MVERFPETHALIDDWYMHLVYGASFGIGFGLAGSATAWLTLQRIWPYAASAALISWVFVVWADHTAESITFSPVELAVARTIRTVQMWGAILALLGFAHRFLNRDHPWRATLNEAVFPCYLAHQTVIIVVEYWLRPHGLSAWSEFAILMPATAGGSWLFYLVGRKTGWSRPLIGLSPGSSRQPGTTPAAGTPMLKATR